MKRLLVAVLLASAWLVPAGAASPARVTAKGETFSALGVLAAGAGPRVVGPGSTVNLTIYINGYTSDEDAHRFEALLADSGPDALFEAIEKADTIGRVSVSGHVGQFELKLIRSQPVEGGRRIIAVSDRPIGFLEAYYGNRSRDYRFGILELDLETKGEKEKGSGVLIYAAKVKIDDNNRLSIENYGIDPVRLTAVRRL
jgi:hypothetical protein